MRSQPWPKARERDYSAIVSFVEHPETKDLYVLSADLAHRTPDKTIERIIEYDRIYRYRDFALEANGFQETWWSNCGSDRGPRVARST